MSTERTTLRVKNLTVEVIRKDIKNLHLGVYPPNGLVRVSAPLFVSDEAVRFAVVRRLPWIRKQRATFERQARQIAREAVSGESHYFFGRRYRLSVVPTEGRAKVLLRTKTKMELHVPTGASTAKRLAVLDTWYRHELRAAAEPLFSQWQDTLEVDLEFWSVKRMKTKWGSCNYKTKRVWLNAELAKKPLTCLEYIVVHELVHLLEPRHTQRFTSLMDEHLPDWRQRKSLLNSSPLANEAWTY